MTGLVHIYTGHGKGKTSAAVGLGIRAYGRGLKVLMVQFLKGSETGEMFTIKKLEPGFKLHRGNSLKKFTWEMNQDELKIAKEAQVEILNFAIGASFSGEWDLVILDEIMAAVNSKLLDKEKVIDFIENKPNSLELVLTGRDAPREFIELGDYVSEIIPVKHPMDKQTGARVGIEF